MLLKRAFSLFFMIVVLLVAGSFLFGCGDPYSKAKIRINSGTDAGDTITLNIDENGRADERTISVKVTGMPSISKTDLILGEIDIPNIAYIDQDRTTYNSSTGETSLTIIAKGGGTAKLNMVAEGGVKKTISILVTERLRKIEWRSTYRTAIKRGEDFVPDFNQIIFTPETASDQRVNYEIRTVAGNALVSGVVFNNGVLRAADTQKLSVTTSYKLVARSLENQTKIFAEVPIAVVDKIDGSKLNIVRTDGFVIDSLISLACNSHALGAATFDVNISGMDNGVLKYRLIMPSATQMTYDLTGLAGVLSTDGKQKIFNLNSNRFSIQQINKNEKGEKLILEVGYAATFDFYSIKKEITVEVVEEPLNIKLNGVPGTAIPQELNNFAADMTIYELINEPQPLQFSVYPSGAKEQGLKLLIATSGLRGFYEADGITPKINFTEKNGTTPIVFNTEIINGIEYKTLLLDSVKTIYAAKFDPEAQSGVVLAQVVSVRNGITLNATLTTKSHVRITGVTPDPFNVEVGGSLKSFDFTVAAGMDPSNLTFVSSDNTIAKVISVDTANRRVWVEGVSEGEFTLYAEDDGLRINTSLSGRCYIPLSDDNFIINPILEYNGKQNAAINSHLMSGDFLSRIDIDNTANQPMPEFAAINTNINGGYFKVSHTLLSGSSAINVLHIPNEQYRYNYRIRVTDTAINLSAVYRFTFTYYGNYFDENSGEWVYGAQISFNKDITINFAPVLAPSMVGFYDGEVHGDNQTSVVFVEDYKTAGSSAVAASAKTINIAAINGTSQFDVMAVYAAPGSDPFVSVIWDGASRSFSFVAGGISNSRYLAEIIIEIKSEKSYFTKTLEVEIVKRALNVNNFTLTGNDIIETQDGLFLNYSKNDFASKVINTTPAVAASDLIYKVKNVAFPDGSAATHTMLTIDENGTLTRHPNSAGTAQLYVSLKTAYELDVAALKTYILAGGTLASAKAHFEELFITKNSSHTCVLNIIMSGTVKIESKNNFDEHKNPILIEQIQNEAILNENEFFKKIAEDPYGEFDLFADIYLTAPAQIETFGGALHGNAHTIYNLNNVASRVNSGALFEVLEFGALIENLRIMDAHLTVAAPGATAGVLAGTNYGIINAIEIGAVIDITYGSLAQGICAVGGIAAVNNNTIMNVYNSSVTLNNPGSNPINFGAISGTSYGNFSNSPFEDGIMTEDIFAFVNLGSEAQGNYGAIFGYANDSAAVSYAGASLWINGGNAGFVLNSGNGIETRNIGISAGGIAGNADELLVRGSYTNIGTSGDELAYFGGIIGRGIKLRIEDSFTLLKNETEISAKWCGGIIGYADSASVVNSQVHGFGSAVLTGEIVGGIAGSISVLEAENVLINDIIMSGLTTGGFAGEVSRSIATYQSQTHIADIPLFVVRSLKDYLTNEIKMTNNPSEPNNYYVSDEELEEALSEIMAYDDATLNAWLATKNMGRVVSAEGNDLTCDNNWNLYYDLLSPVLVDMYYDDPLEDVYRKITLGGIPYNVYTEYREEGDEIFADLIVYSGTMRIGHLENKEDNEAAFVFAGGAETFAAYNGTEVYFEQTQYITAEGDSIKCTYSFIEPDEDDMVTEFSNYVTIELWPDAKLSVITASDYIASGVSGNFGNLNPATINASVTISAPVAVAVPLVPNDTPVAAFIEDSSQVRIIDPAQPTDALIVCRSEGPYEFSLRNLVIAPNTAARIVVGDIEGEYTLTSQSDIAAIYRNTLMVYKEGEILVLFESTTNPNATTVLKFIFVRAHDLFVSEPPATNEIAGKEAYVQFGVAKTLHLWGASQNPGYKIKYISSDSSRVEVGGSEQGGAFTVLGVKENASARITIRELYFVAGGPADGIVINEYDFVVTVNKSIQSLETTLTSATIGRNDTIKATTVLTFTAAAATTEPSTQDEIEKLASQYLDFWFKNNVDGAGVHINSAAISGNKLTVKYELIFASNFEPCTTEFYVQDKNNFYRETFTITVEPTYINSINLNFYNDINAWLSKTPSIDISSGEEVVVANVSAGTAAYLEITPSKILNDERYLTVSLPSVQNVTWIIADMRGAIILDNGTIDTSNAPKYYASYQNNSFTIDLFDQNGVRTLGPIALQITLNINGTVMWDSKESSLVVSSNIKQAGKEQVSTDMKIEIFAKGEFIITGLDDYFAVGTNNYFNVQSQNRPIDPVLDSNNNLTSFGGFMINYNGRDEIMNLSSAGGSFTWSATLIYGNGDNSFNFAATVTSFGNGKYSFSTTADKRLVGETLTIKIFSMPDRVSAAPVITNMQTTTGVLFKVTSVSIDQTSSIEYKINREIRIGFNIEFDSAKEFKTEIAEEYIKPMQQQMLTEWIYGDRGLHLQTEPLSGGNSVTIQPSIGSDVHEYINFRIVPILSGGEILCYSIEGRREGVQWSRITVSATLKYEKGIPTFTSRNATGLNFILNSEFEFKFKDISSEDSPRPIKDINDLMAMNLESGGHYRLAANIYITKHTPLSEVDFLTLDGNGYAIYINSFDTTGAEEETMNLGLFSEIKGIDAEKGKLQPSLVKNLTIMIYEPGSFINGIYYQKEIKIENTNIKQINFGMLAAINNGVVVNCELLSFNPVASSSSIYKDNKNLTLSTRTDANVIFGGLVGVNNGSVTNSRVGRSSDSDYMHAGFGLTRFVESGDKVQPVNSADTKNNDYNYLITSSGRLGNGVNIIAAGAVGGVVGINNGSIASSYFANGSIKNTHTVVENEIGEEISGSITGGMVAVNRGTVAASYAEGIKNDSDEIVLTGSGINSLGLIGGFAYANSGTIEDCYSNIKIFTNAPSAGFVQDNKGGLIKNSYAFTDADTTTNNRPFVGTPPYKNEFEGSLENCFYLRLGIEFDQITSNEAPKDAGFINRDEILVALDTTTATEASSYVSFAISSNEDNSDGIWQMSSRSGVPILVSANRIAMFSSDYIDTPIEGAVNKYNFLERNLDNDVTIPSDYVYIRTARQFNEMLKWYEEERHGGDDSKYVKQNYRIISDIAFTDAEGESVATNLINFKGVLDGNGFVLKNVAIAAGADYPTSAMPLGLFSTLQTNSVVKNINIEVLVIEAGAVEHVGALAGEIIDAAVLGVNIFPVENATGRYGAIYGKDMVGGVAGVIKGNSRLNGINSTVSVTAGQQLDLLSPTTDIFTLEENIDNENGFIIGNDSGTYTTSFAGGIAGIVINCKKSTAGGELNVSDSNDENDALNMQSYMAANAQFKRLSVSGSAFKAEAAVAGGIFGYLGAGFTAHDVKFVTPIFTEAGAGTQAISANYAAGGIVGELRGALIYARNEAENQTKIDEYLFDDIAVETQKPAGYTGLFNLRTAENLGSTYTGGIAGIVRGEAEADGSGIAGGRIIDSISKVPVVVTFDEARIFNVSGRYDYAGGIAGKIENAQFDLCYTTSFVASNHAGGLAGLVVDGSEAIINNINVMTNIKMSTAGANIGGFNADTMFKPVFNHNDEIDINDTVKYISKVVPVYYPDGMKMENFIKDAAGFENFALASNWNYFDFDAKILPFPFYGTTSYRREVWHQGDKGTNGSWETVYTNPESLIIIKEGFTISDSMYIQTAAFKGMIVGKKQFDDQGNVYYPTIKITGDMPPLFSKLQNARIVNVNFEWSGNSHKASSQSGSNINAYGIIAQQALNSRFENIHLKGTGNATLQLDSGVANSGSGAYVGGFVGDCTNTTFNNCSLNSLKIISSRSNGTTALGGFAGRVDRSVFNDCKVFSSVIESKGSSAVHLSAGGLFGYSAGNTTISTSLINSDNSLNDMIVNTSVKAQAPGAFVGGLFGDGSVAKIDNVRISSNNYATVITSSGSSGIAGGFAGRILSGSINNCEVVSLNINGAGTAGGFAGIAGLANIANCRAGDKNQITISTKVGTGSSGIAGGFVGQFGEQGQDGKTIIEYSYSNVTIDSGDANITMNIAGGFAGTVIYGTISQSYAQGSILRATNAGGFVGSNFGKINNCFTHVNLKAVKYAGGFAFSNKNTGADTISYCYSTGNVEGSTDSAAAGFIYKNENTTGIAECFTLSRVYAGSIGGFSFIGNVAGSNRFAHELAPTVDYIADSELYVNNGLTNGAKRVNIEELVVKNEAESNKTVSSSFKAVELANRRFRPHTISAPGLVLQLDGITMSSSTVLSNFDYYVLTTDITLNSRFIASTFCSVLIGNGKTIYTNTSAFDTLKNAVVCNLTVSGIKTEQGTIGDRAAQGAVANTAEKIDTALVGISDTIGFTGSFIYRITTEGTLAPTNNNAGGIVGKLTGSIIESSRNNTDIITDAAYNYVGGIAGYAESNSKVLNSYNAGLIDVGNSSVVGGIAGDMTGTIDNCYNIAPVVASGTAGGIAGSFGGSITNAYNTGLITVATNAGGLVGTVYAASAIDNAYNTGAINAPLSEQNPLVFANLGTLGSNVYYNSDLFEYITPIASRARSYINNSFENINSGTFSKRNNEIFPLLKRNGYFGVSGVGGIKTTINDDITAGIGGQKEGIGANPKQIVQNVAALSYNAKQIENNIKNASYYIATNLNAAAESSNFGIGIGSLRGTIYGNNKQIFGAEENFVYTATNSTIANLAYSGAIAGEGGVRFTGFVNHAINSVICGSMFSSDDIRAASAVLNNIVTQAVGGIAAATQNSSVYNCAVIETEASLNFISAAEGYAGLLVGKSTGGQMINSYATGNVSVAADNAAIAAGGLIGSASGTVVNNCLTKSTVKVGGVYELAGANSRYGALIGTAANVGLAAVTYNKDTQWDFAADEKIINAIGTRTGGGSGTVTQGTTETMYTYEDDDENYKLTVPSSNKFNSHYIDGEMLGNDANGKPMLIGAGTRNCPFLIAKYDSLKNIESNKFYKIIDNVVATSYFTGNKQTEKDKFGLDGKGYVIYGLNIPTTSASGIAMFKTLEADTYVKNIFFEKPAVHAKAELTANTLTALVAQQAALGAQIDNVAINGGSIVAEQTKNNKTTIDSSTGNETANTAPFGSIGAIVAVNDGTISNVYSTAQVRADCAEDGIIGGLVGKNTGTLKYAYASGIVSAMGDAFNGKMSGGLNMGAVVGLAYVGGNIEKETVFYNNELGTDSAADGTSFGSFNNNIAKLGHEFIAVDRDVDNPAINYYGQSINAGMPILRRLLGFGKNYTNRYTDVGVTSVDLSSATGIDSLAGINSSSGTFYLTNNIVGTEVPALYKNNFSGKIYGNGFVITNMAASGTTRAGMFNSLSGGSSASPVTFDRVILINPRVGAIDIANYNTSLAPYVAAGAFAGEATNSSNCLAISNCHVVGGYVYAGATGVNNRGNKASFTIGSAIEYGDNATGAYAYAGGFIGYSKSSFNCNSAVISASIYAKSGSAQGQHVNLSPASKTSQSGSIISALDATVKADDAHASSSMIGKSDATFAQSVSDNTTTIFSASYYDDINKMHTIFNNRYSSYINALSADNTQASLDSTFLWIFPVNLTSNTRGWYRAEGLKRSLGYYPCGYTFYISAKSSNPAKESDPYCHLRDGHYIQYRYYTGENYSTNPATYRFYYMCSGYHQNSPSPKRNMSATGGNGIAGNAYVGSFAGNLNISGTDKAKLIGKTGYARGGDAYGADSKGGNDIEGSWTTLFGEKRWNEVSQFGGSAFSGNATGGNATINAIKTYGNNNDPEAKRTTLIYDTKNTYGGYARSGDATGGNAWVGSYRLSVGGSAFVGYAQGGLVTQPDGKGTSAPCAWGNATVGTGTGGVSINGEAFYILNSSRAVSQSKPSSSSPLNSPSSGGGSSGGSGLIDGGKPWLDNRYEQHHFIEVYQ